MLMLYPIAKHVHGTIDKIYQKVVKDTSLDIQYIKAFLYWTSRGTVLLINKN